MHQRSQMKKENCENSRRNPWIALHHNPTSMARLVNTCPLTHRWTFRSSEVSGRAGMRTSARLLVHRVNEAGGGMRVARMHARLDQQGRAPGTACRHRDLERRQRPSRKLRGVAGCSPAGLVAQAVHRSLVQASGSRSTHPLNAVLLVQALFQHLHDDVVGDCGERKHSSSLFGPSRKARAQAQFRPPASRPHLTWV